MKPILSICIPSYQKADWLQASLRGILNQLQHVPSGDVEVIVSDNASTDATADVLKELEAEFNGALRYYRQSENIGQNNNYAFVLSQANGEFCWMIGNDDYLQSQALSHILKAIQAYPRVDFFYVSYFMFKPPGCPTHLDQLFKNMPLAEQLPQSYTGQHRYDNQLFPHLIDLPALDLNGFTPMYAWVVRRPIWQAAFAYNAAAEPFKNLNGSFGYAAYIIENYSQSSFYYIGQPLLAASQDITWSCFSASITLRNMPDLYALLEKKGVNQKVLNTIEDIFLKDMHTVLPYVMSTPYQYHHQLFSLWKHTKRYYRFKQYWINLFFMMWRLMHIKDYQIFWIYFFKKILSHHLLNLIQRARSIRNHFRAKVF